ncbi:interleukin-23 receptor isoform X2 [Polypterus senegalus]|uniref:interleukin-23 receptor isoform X2 n=1 Tax=Polypterus senegalus TaxID=55291 RepID=UPI0019666E2F|nr:interleukin-23 receptor isoform X2 [Polypterus senegalus]
MNQTCHCCKMALFLQVLFWWNTEGWAVLVCRGIIDVKPAKVFAMGSNISIICHSFIDHCHPKKFFIYMDGKEMKGSIRLNESAVVLHLQDFSRPRSSAQCFVKCNERMEMMVCGSDINAGYPPDAPTGLSCKSRWSTRKITCSWNRGKDTYISTSYTLKIQSSRDSDRLAFPAEDGLTESVQVSLSHFKMDKEYKVTVHAKNDLGEAQSEVLSFTINDTVLPDIPVISGVIFSNFPQGEALLHLKEPTPYNQLCVEVKYREPASPPWIVVTGNQSENKSCVHLQHKFKPLTKYDLSIRCCLLMDTTRCSDWSDPFCEWTPQIGQTEGLDVWRKIETHHSDTKEVTVLWKHPHSEYVRNIITEYQVHYLHHGKQTEGCRCRPSETQCKMFVPAETKQAQVTAWYPKGPLVTAQVTLQPKGCPPPVITRVTSAGKLGMHVMWNPSTYSAVLWYIIEWHSMDEQMSWKKVPAGRTSAFAEGYAPGVHYQIYLWAMSLNGECQPAVTEGYSEQQEPTAGPTISATEVTTKSMKVQWEEISVQQQRGFIQNYTLYVRKGTTGSYLKYLVVDSAVREIRLEGLEPGMIYTLYVTASSSAGEGVPGEIKMVKLDDYDIFFPTVICLTVFSSLGILLIFVFQKSIRKRMKLWAPHCFMEEFPKVENSSVKKLLQNKERTFSNCSWNSIYTDPSVTDVEEVTDSTNVETLLNSVISRCTDNMETCITFTVEDGYKPQITNTDVLVDGPRIPALAASNDVNEQFSEVKAKLQEECALLSSLLFSGSLEDALQREDVCLFLKEEMGGKNMTLDGLCSDSILGACKSEPECLFQGPTVLPDELTACLQHHKKETQIESSYFPQFVNP